MPQHVTKPSKEDANKGTGVNSALFNATQRIRDEGL